MKMFQKAIWLLFVFLATLLQAQSDDMYANAGENKACTKEVGQLLEDAYKHYPSIRASKQFVLSAKAEVESTKWNYFPTPTVDYSTGAGGRTGGNFRLDQPIWTGGKLDALSEASASRERQAQAMLDESAYSLATIFLNLLEQFVQADGEIKSFTKGKEQLEKFSEMLIRRVEAGVSSESDHALLQSRIAQVEADLITAKSRFLMAKSQLEVLIGKPLECGISFKNDALIRRNMSFGKLKDEMLSSHPTLKTYEAQIAITQAEKKGTDAAILPNVSLRAERQRGSVFVDGIQTDTLVYGAVTFSPGAGLSALSNSENAKYKVLQAQNELQTKEAELVDGLISDYASYQSALGRKGSVEETIRASQEVLDSYTRLFIAGKRQWLDLVNTSREVTQNYLSLATLRASLVASSYRLALEAGRLDFESGVLK
jgi:adhesin transport system outer membrane protein